jgi:hypothetical protein
VPSSLSQSHASAAAVFGDELDSSGFKGGAHLIDATNSRVLTCLETVDRIHAYACRAGELLSCPVKGGAGHSALDRLHSVKLSPLTVDSNPDAALPLVV